MAGTGRGRQFAADDGKLMHTPVAERPGANAHDHDAPTRYVIPYHYNTRSHPTLSRASHQSYNVCEKFRTRIFTVSTVLYIVLSVYRTHNVVL